MNDNFDPGEALYFQDVQKRALSSGKTMRQIIDEDREKVRTSMDIVTPDCLSVDEAEELAELEARGQGVLPHHLEPRGQHARVCDFCKAVISSMLPAIRKRQQKPAA